MNTTPVGTTEYDRFGPWIDEVRTPEGLPRLYRDHPVDLAAARLVLKVPRSIARRDATPEMDLYDHLLVLDDEALTVLARRSAPGGVGYDVRELPLGQIAAVHDVVNLLDGTLTVLGRDGTDLTVRYNGSARENVGRLVDLLRAGARNTGSGVAGRALAAAGSTASDEGIDVGRDDLSLVSDFRELARHLPELTAWAWHGRRQVAPRAKGAVGLIHGVLHAISPATLHGVVIAGDGTALEVLGRHDALLRGKKPVHSSSRLAIQLDAIRSVTLEPHPTYAGVTVAVIALGAATVTLLVPDDSATHRLLAAATRASCASALTR
jgi:hypothetical protein